MNDGKVVLNIIFILTSLIFNQCEFFVDVNMERYAEEYDVAIVGGGPDILFSIDFVVFLSFSKII
jgi:hypothetical protein